MTEKEINQKKSDFLTPGSLRRIFFISGLAILGIVYIVLWLRMISSQSERTGSDFMPLYAAGIIYREGDPDQVYDLTRQRLIEEEQVGFALAPDQVLSYNHIPYIVPILSIIVSENYAASFTRWAFFLIILYLASTGIIARWGLGKEFSRRHTLVICAGALTFYPFFVSIMHGQDTAILFLGACLWSVGLWLGRDAPAGLGLALMSIRPQIALFLALPFLFKRQRVFGWFILGGCFLLALSVLILGVDGFRGFLNLLFITARGEWYGMNESAMVNFIGLILRLGPGLNVDRVRMVGWVFFLLSLIGLCILWAKAQSINEKMIGTAIAIAVFSSPHLHYHDLSLLLIPLVTVTLLLSRDRIVQSRNACLIPLGASLVLLLGSLIPGWVFNLPIFLIVLLILVLWFPQKIFHSSFRTYP